MAGHDNAQIATRQATPYRLFESDTQGCATLYTAKGCYPIYAREAMMDMYKQYAALGGNGVITDLVEDLKELPVEKREEKSA